MPATNIRPQHSPTPQASAPHRGNLPDGGRDAAPHRGAPARRRPGARPLRSDLRRRREFCYLEGCRLFFRAYRTIIIDEARNGKVVCVDARCHGAIFAGSDVPWYFHLATGGAL